MKTLLLIMTGVGFTLGVVFGLLLQLPIDNTLPADSLRGKNNRSSSISTFRSRRSLSEDKLQMQQDQKSPTGTSLTISNNRNVSVSKDATSYLPSLQRKLAGSNSIHFLRSTQSNKILKTAHKVLQKSTDTDQKPQLRQEASSNILVVSSNKEKTDEFVLESHLTYDEDVVLQNINLNNDSIASPILSVKLNKPRHGSLSKDKLEISKNISAISPENSLYMASIVQGILWTQQLEKSCPKPFRYIEAEMWRNRVERLDIVKMEEGCGRMQNRMITFRDASKACVRYRLNTDQIQGEIYSYYLSRLLNMSNIPPTMLARVETLSPKWRTVHLKMSMAQWADSKLVVLTEHINGLSPAHIPAEFKEEGSRLNPLFQNLASKTHSELCELVQWSDLIIFDYLTANLDRVINNMFNRQWNDQMMNSPAHNLEQRLDGGLVFLDNESGLFHGYRLLDKYSSFHNSLLHALCIFRSSTVEAVKKLHTSSNIGEELHKIFASSEVLHKHLAAITDKNVKILQKRLHDVYQQITHCEHVFNR